MKRDNITSQNRLWNLITFYLSLSYCIFVKTHNNIRTEMILLISFCATGFSFLPRCWEKETAGKSAKPHKSERGIYKQSGFVRAVILVPPLDLPLPLPLFPLPWPLSSELATCLLRPPRPLWLPCGELQWMSRRPWTRQLWMACRLPMTRLLCGCTQGRSWEGPTRGPI